MKLYIYSRPAEAGVRFILDSGITVVSDAPTSANGRNDAHILELPDDTPSQGGALLVDAAGYHPFEGRGIVTPAGDVATFTFDDVHLTAATATPPTEPPPSPGPPDPSDPFGIIQWVYAGGTGVTFDLAFHEGCGQFTEACARSLFQYNARGWGHMKKNPGQNQYNGHAVDAIQCISGEWFGVYDIITSSVSHDAAPAFNYIGPPVLELWYPPVGPPPTTVFVVDMALSDTTPRRHP